MVTYLGLAVLAALIVFAVYVRVAASDPGRWHTSPTAEGAWGEVSRKMGSASLRLDQSAGDPVDLLRKLDEIALASPRTTRLAGSVEEGRITWITRSALWSFPDYTTAEVRPDGLYLYARQRFGSDDLGVNAARLRDWLSRLTSKP